MPKYSKKKKGGGECKILGWTSSPIQKLKKARSYTKDMHENNFNLFNELTGNKLIKYKEPNIERVGEGIEEGKTRLPLILDLHIYNKQGIRTGEIPEELVYGFSCNYNIPCSPEEKGKTIAYKGQEADIPCETECSRTKHISCLGSNCCEIESGDERRIVYCKQTGNCGEGEGKQQSANTFYFNLLELARQIMSSRCIDMRQDQMSLVWNPVTQKPFNNEELKNIIKSFFQGLRTLAEKKRTANQNFFQRHGGKVVMVATVIAMVANATNYYLSKTCEGSEDQCVPDENLGRISSYASYIGNLVTTALLAYQAYDSGTDSVKKWHQGRKKEAAIEGLKTILYAEFSLLSGSTAGIWESSGLFGINSYIKNFVTYNPQYWKAQQSNIHTLISNRLDINIANKIQSAYIFIGDAFQKSVLDPVSGYKNRKSIWEYIIDTEELKEYIRHNKLDVDIKKINDFKLDTMQIRKVKNLMGESRKLLLSGYYSSIVWLKLVNENKINTEETFSLINIELNNAICLEQEYKRKTLPTILSDNEEIREFQEDGVSGCQNIINDKEEITKEGLEGALTEHDDTEEGKDDCDVAEQIYKTSYDDSDKKKGPTPEKFKHLTDDQKTQALALLLTNEYNKEYGDDTPIEEVNGGMKRYNKSQKKKKKISKNKKSNKKK